MSSCLIIVFDYNYLVVKIWMCKATAGKRWHPCWSCVSWVSTSKLWPTSNCGKYSCLNLYPGLILSPSNETLRICHPLLTASSTTCIIRIRVRCKVIWYATCYIHTYIQGWYRLWLWLLESWNLNSSFSRPGKSRNLTVGPWKT